MNEKFTGRLYRCTSPTEFITYAFVYSNYHYVEINTKYITKPSILRKLSEYIGESVTITLKDIGGSTKTLINIRLAK